MNERISELEALLDEREREVDGLRAKLETIREHVFDAEKTSKAMLFMLEDLTMSEKTIAKAKKEWEDTFDSIQTPLFIHDRGFKIVKCNKAYQALTGFSFTEIIGRPYFEVFPKLENPMEMCRKEETEITAMDRIFKTTHYPIKDINGTYLYSVHLMQDITERKATEDRYKTIIKTAMEGFWLLDAKGRILDVNDAYCRMTGYSRDEVLNMSITDFEAEETPEITARHTRQIMEKGWDRFESRHRCKDHRIVHIDISVTYTKTDEGRFFAFIRDITERKRAEEKIRQEMDTTAHILMIAEATSRITDIDQFLERVVSCANRIMRSDITLSYLLDNDTMSFEPAHAAGLAHEDLPFFKTEFIDVKTAFAGKISECKAIYASGKAQVNAMLSGALSYTEGADAMAVIPLCGREGCLGLLVCLYKSAFNLAEKTAIMNGISHQVSVALEDARLYKASQDRMIDLSRKIETIKVMNEMDHNILSTLDPHAVLETAVNLITKVIPCDRASVCLADREKGGFTYAACFGPAFLKKGASVPFKEVKLLTEVMKTNRSGYVADLDEIRTRLTATEQWWLMQGTKSLLSVPLNVRGEILGILTLGSKRLAAFTRDDLATLEKLAAQVSVALENAHLVSDLEALFLGTVRALSKAIDAKSPWTQGHSERVTKFAMDIGKTMGLDDSEIRNIELAGLMHDIGKLGTYEAILNKPEKLSDEELKLIKQHPLKGAEILEPIKQLKDIIPGVKYHQEFYDGSGYPEGLQGEDIPLMARILGVADTVDAMSADRPYRKGKTMDVIVAELKKCSGTQFDPEVVDAFLKTRNLKTELTDRRQ